MMTLRQAADHTGLSATTLRRYIKSGRLRARLIPGRYGPEYVVSDDDLDAARLLAAEDAEVLEEGGDDERHSSLAVLGTDVVPAILYRELMMKHEQLLVQYGMLRVGGQQLYETRQDTQRHAREIEEQNEELAQLQARHAREIGELKTRLRQAELVIADKDDQIRALRGQIRRLEIALRNAETAQTIDQQFARAVGAGTGAPADH